MGKIVEVLGVPPDHILHMASRTDKFFEKGAGGNWVLRRFRDGRKVWILLYGFPIFRSEKHA